MAHETYDISDPSCYICDVLERYQHRFNPGEAASMNMCEWLVGWTTCNVFFP